VPDRNFLARPLLLGAALLLGACASAPPPRPRPPAMPADPAGNDLLWLERVTYGPTSATLAEYRRVGRTAFLDEQLNASSDQLPPEIATQIQQLDIAHEDGADMLAREQVESKRVNEMSASDDKAAAKKALNEKGNKLAYEAQRRELLRAIYSPNQLREQMVGFWLNHFSVYQYKANVRWLVGDYAEEAIRPHALGHFRDLVMATLEHPAMLQYLDNAQNAVEHVNENYARELMELHTLGVNGGYTQRDVQELARILTGAGVYHGNRPRIRPEWQALYRQKGGFEFNPYRHDFGPKVFLGTQIEGHGFPEIEQAVDLLVHQDACAKFVTRKIAMYFVSDDPPASLTDRMAASFKATDGDIAAVLSTMFASSEFTASLGGKFKDPMHYVVSTVRLAYDARPIVNAHPLINWLNGLGEAPFGHQTPDGYPLTESGWASSSQMSRRFEIARAVGSGNANLFDAEDGTSAAPATGFPRLQSRLYYDAVEPILSKKTQAALDQSNSQQEWNTFLLASPELNYR
jgi:uncharacterized protein (DUF1800 family)